MTRIVVFFWLFYIFKKTYIFLANNFLYGLQKKSRNKLCLEPHATYILFRKFFSQLNNKRLFFHRAVPLS